MYNFQRADEGLYPNVNDYKRGKELEKRKREQKQIDIAKKSLVTDSKKRLDINRDLLSYEKGVYPNVDQSKMPKHQKGKGNKKSRIVPEPTINDVRSRVNERQNIRRPRSMGSSVFSNYSDSGLKPESSKSTSSKSTSKSKQQIPVNRAVQGEGKRINKALKFLGIAGAIGATSYAGKKLVTDGLTNAGKVLTGQQIGSGKKLLTN
jgi:hypothetical protein